MGLGTQPRRGADAPLEEQQTAAAAAVLKEAGARAKESLSPGVTSSDSTLQGQG